MPEFKPGLYRHYKGGFYRALFLASHHETEQQFVVYVPLEYPASGVRVRELKNWFETMLIPNPIEGTSPAFFQKLRFEQVGP